MEPCYLFMDQLQELQLHTSFWPKHNAVSFLTLLCFLHSIFHPTSPALSLQVLSFLSLTSLSTTLEPCSTMSSLSRAPLVFPLYPPCQSLALSTCCYHCLCSPHHELFSTRIIRLTIATVPQLWVLDQQDPHHLRTC